LKQSSIALVALLAVAAIAAVPASGAPHQTPKRGGTVVVGLEREPACLNRAVGRCYGTNAFIMITDKVYPPAFLLAPDLTRRPELVSHVDFTRRAPFVLRYHIRPEARWSDGVPVTARDFVFTLRMIRQHGHGGLRELHSVLRSVRIVDRKTLRVVLRPRIAGWRELFPNVLPWHALRGEDFSRVWTEGIDNPKTGRPIGSGPFLVEEWERGKQLTLVRNPNYWGRRTSRLDRVVVRFCDDCTAAEQIGALARRDVDLGLLLATEVQRLRQVLARATIRPNRFFFWEHLALNLGSRGHPALDRKLVRRAIAYAIDRDAIARDLFSPIDPRYEASNSAVLLNADRRYVPNWKRYAYDPAQSRRLLAQAGCTRSAADPIFSCAGEPLALELVVASDVPHRARAVELMRQQLRSAGIDLRPSFIPNSVLIPQIIPTGAFDIAYFGFVGTFSTGHKLIYGCGASRNFTGYCQRLVTRDLDSADRILDDRQRGTVLNRVDRQLARDVPVIPMYQTLAALVLRRDVRNVVPSPDIFMWNAEDWWLDD
jgi:peptide/nickel transport system substrate-binding protein